ncbi:NAD(P)H-dependent oxidoreductase [Neisseria dentiae]|uniref:NAD(P)H-dependent oxidoreductase n=5 Tax=Neisseria dentiae TaxID=194197 RepID=UPI0035A172B6
MALTTIIYAHPYNQSFNHAVLQETLRLLEAKGEPCRLIDLYADGFNPVYTTEELALFNSGQATDPLVLSYQQILQETQRLILIFPVWWADVPAVVKGFFDKVFLKTLAYTETKTGLRGKLTNIHEALLLTTSTAPTFYLKYFCGNVMEKAIIRHTLKGVGVGRGKWVNFGKINASSAEQRQRFLSGLAKHI